MVSGLVEELVQKVATEKIEKDVGKKDSMHIMEEATHKAQKSEVDGNCLNGMASAQAEFDACISNSLEKMSLSTGGVPLPNVTHLRLEYLSNPAQLEMVCKQ